MTLLEKFERAELTAGEFHHRQHVEVAWCYLRAHPPAEALRRFADGLKRLARALGAAEKYHETLTWAWLLLINERMARTRADDFESFARTNADLLDARAIFAFYRAETLASELARRVFVLPDAHLINQRAA